MDRYVSYFVPLMYVYMANAAASYNNEEILSYLGDKNIFPNQASIRNIIINGHLNVLLWLESKARRLWFEVDDANYAISLGWMDILEWLKNKGITPDNFIYPTDQNGGSDKSNQNTIIHRLNIAQNYGITLLPLDANNAASNGHLHVLIWLSQRGILPNQSGVNHPAIHGEIYVLEWLLRMNILPSATIADYVAGNGHFEVIKWMEEKMLIRIGNNAASIAAENGHLEALKWLFALYDAQPDIEAVNQAAGNGHLDILILLKPLNVLGRDGKPLRLIPNHNGANLAATYGHLDVLIWLAGNRILPDITGANAAANHGHLDVLMWLEQKRIFPTRCTWYSEFENLNSINFAVFDWLKQRNIPIDSPP